MKKILQIVLILVGSMGPALSQTCNIATLQTQADIDNFSTTYPGCKVINGDLSIVSTNISNLNGLSNITRVVGSVAINFNASLTSIAGLSGLEQIDGEINIEDNDNLTTLAGLENFVRPMVNVRVVKNEKLTSISALSGLVTIPGFLSVGENPSLTNLSGLQNLTRVEGAISIAANNALVNLASLTNLNYVGGYFYIARNNSLQNLTGLEKLMYVGNQFQIMDNPALNSLAGLGQMSYVGHIMVINNPQLSDCAVKVVCKEVLTGYVSIYGNGVKCSYDELRVAPECGPDPSSTIRINAGGENFTTKSGQVYLSDRYADGILRVHSIPGGDIIGTDDDGLYRSERSSQSFQYSIPMSNGNYLVVLHFAEIWFGAPGGRRGGVGLRRFNIDVENVRKFTNYDVYERAGGAMIALAEQFPVTLSDGILSLNFTKGAADLPTIAAIEVIPLPGPTEGKTTTVLVQADAHVEDGSFAGQNLGSAPLLGVKDISGGPNRRAYLRFPIEGAVGGGVISAKLRVYGYNQQASDGVLILGVGVDDDSWSENGITWDNAPAHRPTTLGGRVQVNSTLKYWEMDVTEFVAEQAAGDKVVSLALFEASNRNRSVLFHSRENPSGNYPQLIITSRGLLDNNPGARIGLEEKAKVTSSIPGEVKSTVFPNPASRHLTVRLSESHEGNVSMKLISQQGKIDELDLPTLKTMAREYEIDLSKINPAIGIYILKVESDSKTEVVKVLIDK